MSLSRCTGLSQDCILRTWLTIPEKSACEIVLGREIEVGCARTLFFQTLGELFPFGFYFSLLRGQILQLPLALGNCFGQSGVLREHT